MHPLVQSALDAANRGENNKAIEFIKQALAANPNDAEAWLVLAAVVEQPERKRQCLNRVLSLDPTNQIARDELLEMDRAAMGGTPPFVPEPVADTPSQHKPTLSTPNYATSTSAFEPEPVPEPTYQPASTPSYYPSSTSAFEPEQAPKQPVPVAPQTQAKVAPKPSPKASTEKPLVFKYSLFWRIFMYFFSVSFACLGLLMASQDIINGLAVFGMAFLAGIATLWIFPKVEITETGIRASTVLTRAEANWRDIKSVKSNAMKRRLELYKSNGQVVKVSTQVSGYPRIVEIIRQKRPDLFGMAATSSPYGQGNMSASSAYEQVPSSSYGSSVPAPAPAFSGTKNFEKSFIKQYGSYLLSVPLCLLAVGAAFTEPEYRIGAAIAIFFCIAMMIFPLFQVNAIKVEPNKLTVETLFTQKVFSARQIREIKMQSVSGRYGRVTNFVNIIPTQGKNYPLEGFSAGDEVIYGFLTNWWNAYRNR